MCQAFFERLDRFPMQRVPYFFLQNLCTIGQVLRKNIWIALVLGFLSGACGGGNETAKLDVTALDGGSINWRTWSQRDSARIPGVPFCYFFIRSDRLVPRSGSAVFEDSEIARAVARYTLPIWVDADQRPDLFERLVWVGFHHSLF